jgi:hypothetical protein
LKQTKQLSRDKVLQEKGQSKNILEQEFGIHAQESANNPGTE